MDFHRCRNLRYSSILLNFATDEPDFRPALGHLSPSERKQDSLDKELELVKLQKEKVGFRVGSASFKPSSRTSNAPNYLGSAMCDRKVRRWLKETKHRLASGLCSRYVNEHWVQFSRFTIFRCRLFGDDSHIWSGFECAHARHIRSSNG